MTHDSSFDDVMRRLKDGDKDAAAEIFRKFVKRLIGLASRQFEAKFKGKEDPEDVVQSVYKSFFRRQDRTPFDIDGWEKLWNLLATITLNKCINRRDFYRAHRRDAGREIGQGLDRPGEAWSEVVSRDPTALQAAVLAETLEEILGRLTVDDRLVAEMIFQGYTPLEIARQRNCSDRTVRRVRLRIRDTLQDLQEARQPV